MNWLRRNAVGVLGLALAALALALGASAYRYGAQRDDQARAIPFRLQRGETDLAERHRRAVKALSGLADALRTLTFYAAVSAVVAAVWAVQHRPNLWLPGSAIVLAAGAVALALGSRS